MKTVAAFADAGKDVGMGHTMRCIAFLNILKNDFNIFFICGKDDSLRVQKKTIEQYGINIVEINENNFYKEIEIIEADAIIIDSYKVNSGFFTMLKNAFDYTIYIDDLANLPFYDVDILINQNIGAAAHKYPVRKDTVLLLGEKYIMLRDEFTNNEHEIPDTSKTVTDVFVSMGATDAKNATGIVLEMLHNHNFNFHVIIGAEFNHKDEIMKYVSENVFFYEDAKMTHIMAKCQLAISACGSTIYELCSVGMPIIGVVTADNQIKVSSYMHKSGIIFGGALLENIILNKQLFIDSFIEISSNEIIRKYMQQAQLSFISRDGIVSIKEAMLNIVGDRNIEL